MDNKILNLLLELKSHLAAIVQNALSKAVVAMAKGEKMNANEVIEGFKEIVQQEITPKFEEVTKKISDINAKLSDKSVGLDAIKEQLDRIEAKSHTHP